LTLATRGRTILRELDADVRDGMNIERSRIRMLAGAAALVLGPGIRSLAAAAPLPGVTVYKDPT
jgi:hypothetical protein